MRRINVARVVKSRFLAGSELGRSHLPLFVAAALAGSRGESLIWDWSGVELATASYYASAFVPLLRMAVSGEVEMYPIVTGLNPASLEELRLVLDGEGLPLFVGKLRRGNRVGSVELVGRLEAPYENTLSEVRRRKKVSANDLYGSAGRRSTIGKTAWINRLVALNRLRLVRRKRVGRGFVYEPTYLEA
jgi:hypothetical protein